jgi:hypothetical protein
MLSFPLAFSNRRGWSRGVALELYSVRVRIIAGSITGYAESCFSWISSLHAGKCRVSTSATLIPSPVNQLFYHQIQHNLGAGRSLTNYLTNSLEIPCQLRRLVAGFLSQRTGIDLRSGHVLWTKWLLHMWKGCGVAYVQVGILNILSKLWSGSQRLDSPHVG